MGDRTRIKVRQRRRLRHVTLFAGFCLAVYFLVFLFRTPHATDQELRPSPSLKSSSARPLSSELLENLSLGEDECGAAFPGLTKEIDDTVALGSFDRDDSAPVRGRVKDGQIYIIKAQRRSDLSKEMLNSRISALHQLNRAILTSPTPVPDTIFSLNFHDQPYGTAWTYSRPADRTLQSKPGTRLFLMPHFSFWAWNLPFVGSMARAARAIAALEQSYASSAGWQRKIPKAVWRGTAWFNSVHAPRLRQTLVQTARGKPWADVETLEWVTGKGSSSNRNATNALRIEDFCRYKYVVHTEGITYSGRFQFLQMCASVILTPPIQWMQHTTHLARPLFSNSLGLDSGDGKKVANAKPNAAGGGSSSSSGSGTAAQKPRRPWVPSERVRKAWPVQYTPEEANIVFVAPDWSDLEATVAWLEAHPQVAEGIARRQRELFAGGGYFSPAAEACYWRALLRGWAKVSRENDDDDDELGRTFEDFSLSGE